MIKKEQTPMNFKNTLTVLSNDISEIKTLIDGFTEKESLPNIEIDIALDKMRNVYDMLLMLKGSEIKRNIESKPVQEKTEKKPDPEVVIKTELEEPESPKEEIPEEPTGPVEPSTPEVPLEISKPSETKTEKIEVKADKAKPTTLGEKAGESKAFFNETLSQKHPTSDFSMRQQSKPVSDLNKAIGINDKFLFINELFKGDSQMYKKAIEFINNCANFNDAFSYISDNFNWDMESESAKSLLDLIRRKFISGENV